MSLKDTIYWRIFSDSWGIMKKFMPVKETEEYWEAVCLEAKEAFKKYEKTDHAEFAKVILLGVIDELERIYEAKDSRYFITEREG